MNHFTVMNQIFNASDVLNLPSMLDPFFTGNLKFLLDRFPNELPFRTSEGIMDSYKRVEKNIHFQYQDDNYFHSISSIAMDSKPVLLLLDSWENSEKVLEHEIIVDGVRFEALMLYITTQFLKAVSPQWKYKREEGTEELSEMKELINGRGVVSF